MDRRALDRSLAYVDSWLSWRLQRLHVPGCVVAVSVKGRVIFTGAYGDVAAGDVFRIASHSKSFTATAIMQLVEQGHLRLDDAAAQHLGWLADHQDRRWRSVTLRQLLCHGAGVVRDGLDADFWELARPFPDGEQLRAEVLEAQLVLEPNTTMKYSNFGYGVLGAVIETVTGRPYEEHLMDRVVGPLGLAATTPEPGSGDEVVTGYGWRHRDGTRRAVPPVDTKALAPATGFAASAADLCRYFSAHFPGSGKLLSDASKREMQRVHWRVQRPGFAGEEDYGLGLELEQLGGRRLVGHGGGFPGHITKTLADPAAGLVVTALTNASDGPASDVVRGVYHVVDRFQEGAGERPRRGLGRLEGRYLAMSGVTDLAVVGERVAAANPESWKPFEDTDELQVLDATTLRIARTSSFGSEGELVRFELRDGAVQRVRWAGTTMWPEERWDAEEARLLGTGR